MNPPIFRAVSLLTMLLLSTMALFTTVLAFNAATTILVSRHHQHSFSDSYHRPKRKFATTASSASSSSSLFMSSIGGGNDNNRRGGNNNDDDNPLNEWMQRKESENVRFAREQFAEGRLPISYGAMNKEDSSSDTNDKKFGPLGKTNEKNDESGEESSKDGSPTNNSTNDETTSSSSSQLATRNPSKKPNPYLKVVSRLTPSDLISRFTETASPRVQDAVRTTILGLIGGLPQMAFETKTIATGERLASLMFQLQMTGYMFKNAEYRLSLSQSLGSTGSLKSLKGVATKGGGNLLMPGNDGAADGGGYDGKKEWRDGKRIKGKIKVRYGGNNNDGDINSKTTLDPNNTDSDTESSTSSTSDSTTNNNNNNESSSSSGLEIEVDAQAYMSELRNEVSRLRDELDATKQAKDNEIRKDLLLYIRTLPPQELRELTGTLSPEVLDAMKGLVTAVLAGIGGGEDEEKAEGEKGLEGFAGMGSNGNKIGPNTVTEQSGEALAQLCMWQLVVGYNLRELEVREGFRASMQNVLGGNDDDGGFGPGALE